MSVSRFFFLSHPWFSDGWIWFAYICIMKVICMLRGRLYHENRHEKVCVCVWMHCAYMHLCVCAWPECLCCTCDANAGLGKMYVLIFCTSTSVQANTTRPVKESWQKETGKQKRRGRRRGCCWSAYPLSSPSSASPLSSTSSSSPLPSPQLHP